MGNLKSTRALILLLLNLEGLFISLACPDCPYATPPSKYPATIPKPPPHVPKHPTGKLPHLFKLVHFPWGYRFVYPHGPPSLRPPRLPGPHIVHPPPIRPQLPIFATLPITPKPPIVYPPIIPTPPITSAPPVITPPHLPQPPSETPSPPPPPQETPHSPPAVAAKTCPTLKLDECIDELGSLVHVGIDSKAKDTCCPVLAGLLDLDAALCLCTTIKAKLLNINPVIPIARQVLADCGKTLPFGFQCPA